MENTKKFIIDMESEERNKLIKFNKKLMQQLQNDLHESNLELQYIDSKNIMDDDALNAIKYHDNYTSFFYTLKDWRKFITHIDTAYLSDEAQRLTNEIYKNIDIMDALDYCDDKYHDINEECEELSKKVLKDIEEYLHTYEEYPDEDEAIEYAEEMEWLNNYYIEIREDGTSDNIIRKDISYTEIYL